ncbi:glutamine amidotransferase-related protein [Desulfosarcina alkanivorans]
MPLSGICYGHQIIATTMGGGVEFHLRSEKRNFFECHISIIPWKSINC